MKKFFCENCGCRLNEEDLFCENCGYPMVTDTREIQKKASDSPAFSSEFKRLLKKDVPISSNKIVDEDLFSFFSREDWESRWHKVAQLYGNENLGIILINQTAMNDKDRSNDSDFEDFVCYLEKYVAFRREQGIFYFVLDISSQRIFNFGDCSVNIQNVVNVLRKIYQVEKPKYLFMIGNEEVFDSVVWENRLYEPPSIFNVKPGDDDQVVNSDLPYFTFDFASPWDGQRWQDYSFESCVRVGRLPCHSYDSAIAYLGHVVGFGGERELNPFALSAKTWEKTSKTIYHTLGEEVYTSPIREAKDFMAGALKHFCGGQEPNLLFFNLHGNLYKNEWFGERIKECEEEKEEDKPKAFSADCLPFLKSGYVIGTEACYGAKPCDEESILCTALQNGCIAFLGSTQSAYGFAEGPCGSADILVGEWLEKVAEGYTFGDAYIEALKKLCQRELDSHEIKTLAEFSLYGDPSLSLLCKKPTVMKSLFKKSAPLQKGIHIPMPDVRRIIELAIIQVSEKIQSALNSYIEENHSEFIGTTPYFCEVKGRNEYHAVYSMDVGMFSKTMVIYFDKKNGKVEKVYFSK